MISRKFYFDPAAEGLAVFMGQTEAALMELAWRYEKLTVKKALFHLDKQRLAYTTVMTVLSRLADKGLLVKEKEGRNYIYRPALDRERFIKEKSKIVADCLKKNFKAAI